MRVTTLSLLVLFVAASACKSSSQAHVGNPDASAEAGIVDGVTSHETPPAGPDVANDGPVDQPGADREPPDLRQGPETAPVVPDVAPDRDVDRPASDLSQASDLPPDSFSCVGAWVFPSDQQSCVNATCVPHCDPGPPPVTTVTSAPGGPLLTEVRVTSGSCVGGLCYPSAPSCSQISISGVSGLGMTIGATCDLVAISTDGRSQSFRITVVQSGPAVSECCGYPYAPYFGLWTTSTPLRFDPVEVVVDFNRDGGVSDGGANDGAADREPPDSRDATVGGLSVDQVVRTCAIGTSCASVRTGLSTYPSVFTPTSCVDSIASMAWFGGSPYQVADPTMVARLMACAKNSDCAAFHACFGGGLVTVSRCQTNAGCTGNVLTSIDGSFDCSSIGATCQLLATDELRACCNEVACEWPPAVTCHGTSTGSLCGQSGEGLPFDCSLSGRVCSTDPQAVCQGTGAACAAAVPPSAPTCSGSVATYCSGGKLATYDCGQSLLRRACDESALYGMPCRPSGTACNSRYNGECDGTALLVCVDGEKVAVSCPDLGFAGCAVRADGIAICN